MNKIKENYLLGKLNLFLSNKNFSYTVVSRLTDIGLKFGVLVLLIALGPEYVVEYTYFVSLSAILSVVIDFGTSRKNVRTYKKTGVLTLNFYCLLIAVISYFSIKTVFQIKFYSDYFLLICILLALINAWKTTLIKYFEFVNKNKNFYKVQMYITIITYPFLMLVVYFTRNLNIAYFILLISNSFVLLIMLYKSRALLKLSYSIVSLVSGFPFLLNSIASMAFSQVNIIILNQFSTPYLISNFVIAQRLIELSLTFSNSYISSEIGKFFNNKIKISYIRNKAFKYWLFLFLILIPVTFILKFYKPNYDILFYVFIAFLPLGFLKSITPTYSIVMDYTQYYYYRTIVIGIVLLLNLTVSKHIYGISNSLYHFIFFINFLLLSLLVFYIVSFKKLKIYENYHS